MRDVCFLCRSFSSSEAQVRATVLCENSVGQPFDVIGEHGFSAYIETQQGNYLFDTGA